MGNKSGKFMVSANATENKDAAIVTEPAIKVEDSPHNGDHVQQAVNNIEESAAPVAPKKSNVLSWLKKISVRKEKKPKAPKENGVKEEIVEPPKENGDVTEEEKQTEEATAVETVVTNGHKEQSDDEKETTTETVEKADETPVSNGHENEVESVESPVEEKN